MDKIYLNIKKVSLKNLLNEMILMSLNCSIPWPLETQDQIQSIGTQLSLTEFLFFLFLHNYLHAFKLSTTCLCFLQL